MSDGGWTRILRRENGGVDFDRLWIDYKAGFGDVTSEYYLGNDVIHQLTNDKPYKLQIDMTEWDGNSSYVSYGDFMIESESSSYLLTVSGFSGTDIDALAYHNSHTFKTRDNDRYTCAQQYSGGWWFDYCMKAHLNAVYWYNGSCNQSSNARCISWGGSSLQRRFKEVTMKIQGSFCSFFFFGPFYSVFNNSTFIWPYLW